MNQTRLLVLAFLLTPALSAKVEAQSGFGRITAGVLGGVTLPRGDFGQESKAGWHAGGLIKARAYGVLDIRVDGTYSNLGSESVPLQLTTGDTLSFHFDPVLSFGTVNALLNLGPDSSAYPGDNSASPYIMAGMGLYHLDYKFACTGACTSITGIDPKTHYGVNVGFGTTFPLAGIRTFIEGRYHRISRSASEGNARSMVLVSAGIKIR